MRKVNNLVKVFPVVIGASLMTVGFMKAPAANPLATPPGTTPFKLTAPLGLPALPLPADNPLTVEGILLGERLFFDPILSGNKTMSCSTCHNAVTGFSDAGFAVSAGIDGKNGTRNAPGLSNMAYMNSFFWDGRSATLRAQALLPIQNPIEMHDTLPNVIAKLNADKTYPAQFAKAFGSAGVTPERLGLAMEQFELTITSGNSKFDNAVAGKVRLTAQELRGFQVFNTPFNPKKGQFGGDCVRCHSGALFSDFQFTNDGLDAKPVDPGRMAVSGLAADNGKFKTPSLRNLPATGPYMHDGRLKTLQDVVNHYSQGIVKSPTLDPGLAAETTGGVRLSTSDQAALVAFLKTLMDPEFSAPGVKRP